MINQDITFWAIVGLQHNIKSGEAYIESIRDEIEHNYQRFNFNDWSDSKKQQINKETEELKMELVDNQRELDDCKKLLKNLENDNLSNTDK